MRLQLLMCRHCRCYKAQLAAMGKTARNLWGALPVDPAAGERIEREALARAEQLRDRSD
ncbi:MAG: hypothetical protein GF355_16190 [Candidatus Eisenbacteria bacterium]|nr:hypothetical protein [Candidatus Eisenbacteria bacterium]